MISYDDQGRLLALARESIAATLKARDPTLPEITPAIRRRAGAFVTITNPARAPALRGCIGRIESSHPLVETVRWVSVQAAFHDHRFEPVGLQELEQIELEITVLSPPVALRQPKDIVIGEDGLIVRKGSKSGLLLPRVASDRHWDSQTFLEQTCRKAGLPLDAWKDESTSLLSFKGFAFDEREVANHLSRIGNINAGILHHRTGPHPD